MTTSLATTQNEALATRADDAERLRRYLAASMADATVRAYQSDLRQIAAWLDARGYDWTAEALAAYLTTCADEGMKRATIERRMAAMRSYEATQGLEASRDARVRQTMKGIRRELAAKSGTSQKQARPLLLPELRTVLEALADDESLAALRDRALLLIGWGAALRRSELVALCVEDCEVTPQGVTVTVRRSKTDQTGEGMKRALPMGRAATCPVRALRTWLDAAGIESGPVFRSIDRHGNLAAKALSGRSVNLIICRRAEAAGLEATGFSGHSLRAGLATSAAMNGAQERDIARQTGHRSMAVLRRYIRDGELYGSGNVAGQML